MFSASCLYASDFQWEIDTARPAADKQFRLTLSTPQACSNWQSVKPVLRESDLVINETKIAKGPGCKFIWIIYPKVKVARAPFIFNLLSIDGKSTRWVSSLADSEKLFHEDLCPVFRAKEYTCIDIKTKKENALSFDLYKKNDGKYYRISLLEDDGLSHLHVDKKQEYRIDGKKFRFGYRGFDFNVVYRCEAGIYYTNSELPGQKTEVYYRPEENKLFVRGNYVYTQCNADDAATVCKSGLNEIVESNLDCTKKQ